MALQLLSNELKQRITELTAQRLQRTSDVTRQVRGHLGELIAPEQIVEATLERAQLTIRLRSATAASHLHFSRIRILQLLSSAFSVRIQGVRFRV